MTESSHTPCREYKKTKVYSGFKVGRLLVQDVVGRSPRGSKLWRCQCDCGNIVDVIASTLNAGNKQSCGCLNKEMSTKKNKTHGLSRTKTYNSWQAMKQRCYDSKSEFYEYYGGRGITVCREWQHSFAQFHQDMGDKPKGMSIDRIDVNGHYNKENCRWSTNSLQGFNTTKHSDNTSGATGVSYHKRTQKWGAYIGFENKRVWLGVFESFEEALSVRKQAELTYFGFNKED